MAKIIGRSATGKETQPLLEEEEEDENEDGTRVIGLSPEEAVLISPEIQTWLKPKQLPISAETVFLSHFRSHPRAFHRKTKGPMTIDDAWDDLSPYERQCYIAEAKENHLKNTAKNAELNKRCPLSPSMEDVSSVRTLAIPLSELNDESGYLMKSRRLALQRWQRYRSDHPAACGTKKTIVPEKPFRIMDLPFEMRREIFSLVLRQSYPVLHFPSDGSADALHGPVDVRLFVVSRQVFAEAVKVFYEENTFGLNTAPSSYLVAMPLYMQQSTGSEAPRPTNSIRRVHITFCFTVGPFTDTDTFRFLWKKFCEFLTNCRNLRTVELSVRGCPGRDFIAMVDLQIQKLAWMLMGTSDIIVNIAGVMTDGSFEYCGVLLPFRRSGRRIGGMVHERGE